MPSINTNLLSFFVYTIPAREVILTALRQAGGIMNEKKLARSIGVKKNEYEGLSRRLRAMERDRQIEFMRDGDIKVLPTTHFIPGVVVGHRDGYGFLRRLDGKGEDLFLSQREMQRLMHGDRVLVTLLLGSRRARKEGHVVEILERTNLQIIGRLFHDLGRWYVQPSDIRIPNLIEVPTSCLSGADANDMVELKIIYFPEKFSLAVGKVIRIIGTAGDAKTEIEVVIRKLNIPFHFSLNARQYALNYSKELNPSNFQNRVDLRKISFVTIDDQEAKDFDDAIYAERVNYNGQEVIRLLVAIADVSHYIHDGDPVDLEALERGCSVYFPHFVVPMIPEVLSNGLCSLLPNVDRFALVCDMYIDSSGMVVSYKFYRSIIRSMARLTYDEVFKLLEAEDKISTNQKRKDAGRVDSISERKIWFGLEIDSSIQCLHSLYLFLSKARLKRGAINFETIETSIFYDKNGKIEKIQARERNDAHKLVEECMLAANVCAASLLDEYNHPILYRIHAGPTPEKLKSLRIYLRAFGLELTGGDEPRSSDYANLISSIKKRSDFPVLQAMLLRSLQQAVYSPKNIGHFGLAYSSYTHFTSPIRRYPDLLVHRAICAVLKSDRYIPCKRSCSRERVKKFFLDNSTDRHDMDPKKHQNNYVDGYSEKMYWEKLGLLCSKNERRAEEASRDIDLWFKCCFMKDKVGAVFNGIISAVSSLGLFVTLEQFFIEGLLHISEFGKKCVKFDEEHHKLVDEITGKTFALQDSVIVQVIRVDIDRRKIFLALSQNMEKDVVSHKSMNKKKNRFKEKISSRGR